MKIDELYKKWQEIRRTQDGYLLISGTHPLSFHIGFSKGKRCFVILNTGRIEKIKSSKAIEVKCIKTDHVNYSIFFFLNYPSLDELFFKLCWDLIESSLKDTNPLDKIVERYKKWICLLQKGNETAMSISRQKGLIGELEYLSEMIDIYGEEKAIIAWGGPNGTDQDFEFEDRWVEIKTTAIASDIIVISSLQQLDRADNGNLVVYFMDSVPSQGNNITLLSEIKKVREKITSEEIKDMFNCKLTIYGYLEKDNDNYSSSYFRLSGKNIYTVDQSFPRLTKENIPPSVVSAKYILSLSSIDTFKTEE